MKILKLNKFIIFILQNIFFIQIYIFCFVKFQFKLKYFQFYEKILIYNFNKKIYQINFMFSQKL